MFNFLQVRKVRSNDIEKYFDECKCCSYGIIPLALNLITTYSGHWQWSSSILMVCSWHSFFNIHCSHTYLPNIVWFYYTHYRVYLHPRCLAFFNAASVVASLTSSWQTTIFTDLIWLKADSTSSAVRISFAPPTTMIEFSPAGKHTKQIREVQTIDVIDYQHIPSSLYCLLDIFKNALYVSLH